MLSNEIEVLLLKVWV